MSRPFQIVEDKIEEAEFFLNILHFENTDIPQFNFRAAYFYLSAFLSAARSITFCLQASLKDVEGFESWYQEWQNKLRDNELARFFLEARNLSQKVGYYPIGGGRMSKSEDGIHHVELYFEKSNREGLKHIPDTDIVTTCENSSSNCSKSS